MPTYQLSIFPLTAWSHKRIDKICRFFLWKGKTESNGGNCLVAWPLVSKPKDLDDLGVINLDKFGHALCLRWLWKECTREHHPWKGLEVPCNQVDRLLFSASTTVTIGDGNTAMFWHDSWLDGMAPRNIAPHLFELISRKNKSVACCWASSVIAFSVMTVCNLPLWEYSGDSPGTRGHKRPYQRTVDTRVPINTPVQCPLRGQINRVIAIPRRTLQTLSPLSRWIHLSRKSSTNTRELSGQHWIKTMRSKITSTIQIEEFVSLWTRLQDF
jgi:hypothetical protein